MRIWHFIPLMFLCCNSATQNDGNAVQRHRGPVSGVWVELSGSGDTLDFDRLAPRSVMLNRARENGSRPKSGYGFYHYQLERDSILLLWSFSSSAKFKEYYFRSMGDTLAIGNFYDIDKPTHARTMFVRVK